MRQLGERSGISKDAISEIERGLREPRISTVMELVRGLDMDPQELLSDIVQTPQEPPRVGTSGPFTAVYERGGDWWIGYVEELPGANAQEASLQECRESLREAVELVLEANRELTRREFEGRDVVRELIGA